MEEIDKILKKVLKKLCWIFGIGYTLAGIIHIVVNSLGIESVFYGFKTLKIKLWKLKI